MNFPFVAVVSIFLFFFSGIHCVPIISKLLHIHFFFYRRRQIVFTLFVSLKLKSHAGSYKSHYPWKHVGHFKHSDARKIGTVRVTSMFVPKIISIPCISSSVVCLVHHNSSPITLWILFRICQHEIPLFHCLALKLFHAPTD